MLRAKGWSGWLGLAVLALLPLAAAGPPDKGDKAPEFALKDLDGQTVKLSELKGKVVMLDFWATWCGPCRHALPHTQKLSESKAAKDGKLAVLAISLDKQADTVRAFMKENKYTFRVPLGLVQGAPPVAQDYGVRGIPTFLVIGHDGVIDFRESGAGEATEKALDAAIDDALEAQAKAKA